jgi:chitinase
MAWLSARRTRLLGPLALLGLVTALLAPSTSAAANDGPDHRSLEGQRMAYFAQWRIYSGFFPRNVDTSGAADRLTTINYAFGNVSEDGRCFIRNEAGVGDAFADFQRVYAAGESVDGVADTSAQPLRGNFNQLRKLKAKHPQLKVLISLGGFTWSKFFSNAALTPESRRRFAQSCIDLYVKGNLPRLADDPSAGGEGAGAGVFDGIDVDWEYPAAEGAAGNVVRPEDTRNFTLLLAELRRQLGALGRADHRQYLLTAAVPAGTDKIAKIEVGRIHTSLDWLNLLTYDFHGPWESTGPTQFHSNLFLSPDDPNPIGSPVRVSVHDVVNAYLDGGTPRNKVVVGVPAYGHGWTGVAAGSTNGLFQPAAGPASDPEFGAGTASYRTLERFAGQPFRDAATRGFWKYDGTTFWAYDDPGVLLDKASYVTARRLGGLYMWELSLDDEQATLVRTIDGGLDAGQG